jgi:DNA modification methylase
MREGFRFIGIEQEAEYIAVARARIARAYEESALIWEQQREATSNG